MNRSYYALHCGVVVMKKIRSFGYMLKQSFADDISEDDKIRIKYRPYQQELIQKYEEGVRFFLICWARRLGKDMFAFSIACREALDRPNGIIYYMFVTQKQGKTVLLDGYTEDGQRIIESVLDTKTLIKTKSGKLYHNDNSMRFRNGSIIYFVDSENPDTKVGGNINLLVCSEAALYRNPSINEYLIPAVLKVKGKIIKVSSPRFASAFNKEALETDNLYYKSILSAEDERAVDENGIQVYTDELFEYNRKMMSAERYSQEILCDLEAANETSIYSKSLRMAERRDCKVSTKDKIFISFDLGIRDATAMTFGKFTEDNKLIVFHHYKNNNQPTKHYIDYIKDEILEPNKLDQRNITIILPHDGRNRHDAIETLVSREKAYKDAGFKVQVLSQVVVNEAIETTRAAIQHHELIFAKNNNIEEFISFLKEYEWKINKLTGENTGIPNHGINISASNSADSLEYMAITFFFKKKIDKSAYSKSQIQRLGRDY